MDYEEYYTEPSEFDEKCTELIQMLKDSATDELKTELEQLRAENARMKDIVENYDDKVRELDRERDKLCQEKRNAMTKAKQMRLSELFEDFVETAYCVKCVYTEKPKCDKCDEDGYIHYLSPQGRKVKERCDCRVKNEHYEITEAKCKSFKRNTWGVESYNKLLSQYIPDSDDEWTRSCDYFYNGEDYSELSQYRAIFRTPEEAQKYADWLNEKEKEQ